MFETTNQLKSLYTSVSPILMGKLMVAGKNLFRNSASSTMTLPWKVTTLFQNVKIGRAPKERARCVICIIVFIFQDTLLYTIIHYYTLLYTIIHYYTLHYYTLLLWPLHSFVFFFFPIPDCHDLCFWGKSRVVRPSTHHCRFKPICGPRPVASYSFQLCC